MFILFKEQIGYSVGYCTSEYLSYVCLLWELTRLCPPLFPATAALSFTHTALGKAKPF